MHNYLGQSLAVLANPGFMPVLGCSLIVDRVIASHKDLTGRLDELEKKYYTQFKVVIDAIRQLMAPPETKKRKIGFLVKERAAHYGRSRGNEGEMRNVKIQDLILLFFDPTISASLSHLQALKGVLFAGRFREYSEYSVETC
ncbi:MAG: hypothetical protein O7B35_03700 [Deltaproteobacteria bacterium]|nr:hypothetical protein [Deltaproteobacteria bacterium]